MSPSRRRSTKAPASDRELELKYSVGDIDDVRQAVDADVLSGLRAGPWRTLEVVDQYVDTTSGALARAGYGARLRHSDGRTTLTLKGAPRRATAERDRKRGLHDRMELEGRANRRLDPRQWPDSAARSVVEATVGAERLRTLFHVDQRREERDLIRDGAVVARLSLDAVEVRRLGRPLGSFATLEVESVDSAAPEARATLRGVAEALEDSDGLRPEPRSKEEIARELVDRSQGALRVAKPPRQAGVEADDQLSEAGRKVLRMHLLRMLSAEPGVRAGGDVEAVHKMRVATRRMRAAWRVFSGAFRPRAQKRYVGELRTVARALGAVRDMDVQLERLTGYRGKLDQASADALGPLAEELQRRREDARDALLDLLASSDYDRFVADYRSFVESPGSGAVEAPGRRVRDVAGGRAWRAYERVRTHDATLQWADAPAMHALRIDGKRLRYTLEFFREILPSSADGLISEVTQLQDHLGLLNDSQIAADMTRSWMLEFAVGLSSAQRQAAGNYVEANQADVTRLRRAFRPMWRKLAGRSFRRRLALAVGAI